MKYLLYKQTFMKDFVSTGQKFGMNEHLGAYTLIKNNFFKVQNLAKDNNKK